MERDQTPGAPALPPSPAMFQYRVVGGHDSWNDIARRFAVDLGALLLENGVNPADAGPPTPLQDGQVVRIPFPVDPNRYYSFERLSMGDIEKRYGGLSPIWDQKIARSPRWRRNLLAPPVKDWMSLWNLWENRGFREWQLRNGGGPTGLTTRDKEKCPPLFVPQPVDSALRPERFIRVAPSKPSPPAATPPQGSPKPSAAPGNTNVVDSTRPRIELFGPWDPKAGRCTQLDVLRPALYDNAVTHPLPAAPGWGREKDLQYVLGTDRNDDDFINRDSHRFFVRIRDRKGLGTIRAKWDTYDRGNKPTSFLDPGGARIASSADILLWEDKLGDWEEKLDEHSAYYYSPWLMLTTGGWEVQLAGSGGKSSSALTENLAHHRDPCDGSHHDPSAGRL